MAFDGLQFPVLEENHNPEHELDLDCLTKCRSDRDPDLLFTTLTEAGLIREDFSLPVAAVKSAPTFARASPTPQSYSQAELFFRSAIRLHMP